MKKKTKVYVSSFCLLVAVIGVTLIIVLRSRPLQPTYPISRHIQYVFTLQNKTNRPIKKARLWTYAPVKQTPTQRCGPLETSYPHRLITDDPGNQVLHFILNDLAPFASKIITIKAQVLLSPEPNLMPGGDLKAYLRPEKYIESDHPDLHRLAQKLRSPSPLKTAEKVFQWVSSNVRYAGYLRNDRGALYALQNRKGDCTEYMYLFAALCRANEIPTRCIGGYICGKSMILKPSGYHNWAEFYLDGAWRVADPQNKIFMTNPSRYIAMRIIRGSDDDPAWRFNRFRFEGDGLRVKMN